MSHPVDLLPNAINAIREQLVTVTRHSERTLLLGTVLLVSAVSAAMGFVLTQYFAIDVFSSLLYVAEDCWLNWGTDVGRHCFADYAFQVTGAMVPNPWAHFGPPNWGQNPYPAAALAPFKFLGFLGKWLDAPRLVMFGYLIALTFAVLSPALWAARGVRGLDRIVVFVACGAAAIPAWIAVDRGNSVGFLAPIALVFLVALRRRRWGLVTIMVVLAALVKPQFAVLGVTLFAARQWRWGGIAMVGIVFSNLVAYLLWPQNFPETIRQSIQNAFGYTSSDAQMDYGNISFGKVLLLIPDTIETYRMGVLPENFLAGPRSLIGNVILVLVVAGVLALGRRIPPVMAGIVLLATVTFFPAVSYRYYLVFALPVAALVVRDPDGPPDMGIFDRLGDRRRAVGICVSLAAALSIAPIAIPGPPVSVPIALRPGNLEVSGMTHVLTTTATFTPILWLIACVAIIFSYARRPAPRGWLDISTTAGSVEPTRAPAGQIAATAETDCDSGSDRGEVHPSARPTAADG